MESENKAWSIIGVAGFVFLSVLVFSAGQCTQKQNAEKYGAARECAKSGSTWIDTGESRGACIASQGNG